MTTKEPLLYSDVNTMLYKVSRRARIKRRIHPHLFRHTRATILARDLKEAPLEATMGWVHGSKMSRVYVHLSDQGIDNAVLKVYGIKKETDEKGIEYVPKVCQLCKESNPTVNEYCYKCGYPLDYEKIIELENKQKEAEDTILSSSVVVEDVKNLLRDMDPESKDKLIEEILTQIVSDRGKHDKFVNEAREKKKNSQE